MPILFILGRPGSGKSEVARWIARQEPSVYGRLSKKWLLEGWGASHITDYGYLLQIFQEEDQAVADSSNERFVPSEYGGFKVTKLAVLDEALALANTEILVQMNDPHKLILVEFARNEYRAIWDLFDPVILESAYFLYLQADLELCIERVHKRALRKRYEDDTFVPDDVIRYYYQVEQFADLQETFGQERVRVINNSGNWNDTWTEVQRFVTTIEGIKTDLPGDKEPFLILNRLARTYIEKAFECLPWFERNALLLYTDAGLTPPDIGEILGLSEKAVLDSLVSASQLWLQAYESFLERDLSLSLNSIPVSDTEDLSRVKRLIQSQNVFDNLDCDKSTRDNAVRQPTEVVRFGVRAVYEQLHEGREANWLVFQDRFRLMSA